MSCSLSECEFSVYDEDALDMAIFISPQYKDDEDILDALYIYMDAVYNDINWNIGIVEINEEENQYNQIKTIINNLRIDNPIKSNMFIGEDIGQTWEYYTEINKRRPACWGDDTGNYYPNDLATAFLIPNNDDKYENKKDQITHALNKFSNRNINYVNDICAFVDSSWDPGIYQVEAIKNNIPKIGELFLFENANRETLDEVLSNQYKMFIAGGHGCPNCVNISRDPTTTRYETSDILITDAPVIALSGCYTNGWYIPGNIDKNTWYPPTKQYNAKSWFGHTIFENESIRALVIGFAIGTCAKNSGNQFDIGFVCTGMDDLAYGKTIAEAIGNKHNSCSRNMIYGDPTFHY